MEAATDHSEQIRPIISEPLQVATFGIGDKAIKAMELAFKNYGNNCAVIVNEQQAQVGIFDFDDIESRRKWIKFKAAKRDASSIILCSKEMEIQGAYVVTKPMRVGKFIAIFQDIRNHRPGMELSAVKEQNPTKLANPKASQASLNQSSIQAPDINAVRGGSSEQSKTQQESKPASSIVLYSPEKYLQAIVSEVAQEAREKDIIIDLVVNVHDEWETISFFPRLERVASDMNEQQLRYVCSTKLFCLETKIFRHSNKDSRQMEQERAGDESMESYEVFLWKVALWTGAGRLPKNFDQNAHYQLRRWPNLSRLEPIAGAMTMSALLTEKPIRLALFLKLTALDPRNVAAFLTCTQTVGLLKTVTANTKIEALDEAPLKNHPTRGIFQKILDTLKGKS